LAIYQAVKAAVHLARSGGGPTLVEANTIRMMPHSSSDDHLRYRTQEDLENERKLDPIPLFRDFLITTGILDETSDQELQEFVDLEVEEAIELADAAPSAAAETAFNGVYAP
jgi:2-oxoisovalerate dehydrogenase E1 component alpha subunit